MIDIINKYYLIMAKTPKLNAKDIGIPTGSIDSTVTGVLNTAYFIAGMVAVVVIVVAGFIMTASGGDPSKVKTAKNMILGAVIGIVLIISAATITFFVTSSI